MMQALQLDLDLYPRFEFDHKVIIVNSDAFDICDYYSYFLSESSCIRIAMVSAFPMLCSQRYLYTLAEISSKWKNVSSISFKLSLNMTLPG